MEFSQYSNVWAMLIGAAGVAVMGTNLRVEAVDSLVAKFPWGYKVTRVIIDVAELVFYIIMTHSGYLLATKAKQKVSTMPRFTMGQVYWIFPVAGVLCIIGVLIHLAVTLSTKPEDKEEA
jgi:TRAP-type C4-dicarboxylate transport system permease small subunit